MNVIGFIPLSPQKHGSDIEYSIYSSGFHCMAVYEFCENLCLVFCTFRRYRNKYTVIIDATFAVIVIRP